VFLEVKGHERLHFFPALRADDPQDDMPEGDSPFENDADHVACGETQGIENTKDGLFCPSL